MLQRQCATVRRRAIELTYKFEVAGSRRPGGIMVSVFFLGVLLLCVVGCVVHVVTVG